MATTPTILFLCPHNTLRSVIAAALCNQLAVGRARGESAGTDPDERVNERTITVLREVGIDVADQEPGRVSRQQLEQADRVISLGCPLAPDLAAAAAGKIHEWLMPDTTNQPVEAVRQVRELIKVRVQQLLREPDGTDGGKGPR